MNRRKYLSIVTMAGVCVAGCSEEGDVESGDDPEEPEVGTVVDGETVGEGSGGGESGSGPADLVYEDISVYMDSSQVSMDRGDTTPLFKGTVTVRNRGGKRAVAGRVDLDFEPTGSFSHQMYNVPSGTTRTISFTTDSEYSEEQEVTEVYDSPIETHSLFTPDESGDVELTFESMADGSPVFRIPNRTGIDVEESVEVSASAGEIVGDDSDGWLLQTSPQFWTATGELTVATATDEETLSYYPPTPGVSISEFEPSFEESDSSITVTSGTVSLSTDSEVPLPDAEVLVCSLPLGGVTVVKDPGSPGGETAWNSDKVNESLITSERISLGDSGAYDVSIGDELEVPIEEERKYTAILRSGDSYLDFQDTEDLRSYF